MQEGINRLQFIDNMKTIGIIAVVVGHAPGLSKYFEAILYGFHVPLFFFVTGALLSNAKLSSSPKIFILRQARELLIPYLGFFLLSYGYWLLTRHHGNSSERFANTSWVDPLIGFASGKGSSILVNVVLWFFPALFSAKLIYFFVLKFLSKNAALFLLAIFAILYFFIQQFYNFRLWFGIDCAIYGVIFIAAGAISNRHLIRTREKSRNFFHIILLTPIYLALALINGKVDLNNAFVGNIFLYFATAFIGCWIIYNISCLFQPNAISRWISTHTLFIFPLHWIFFRVTTGILQLIFQIPSPYINGNIWWTMVYSTIGIGLVIPYVWIFNIAKSNISNKIISRGI